MDNLHSVLLAFGLPGEGKDVLGLSIGDLVDPEPLVGRSDQSGQMPLNILDVIEPGSQRVVDVYYKDLPVGLAFIQESHDTEDFDLLDLTDVADVLADLAHVERVVVPVGTGFGVLDVGVFPGLREGTVVPDVAWMSAGERLQRSSGVLMWSRR